jgi:adenine-specific DNA methylase
MHADLKTGICPRRLVAVEETREGEYRRIRAPSECDHLLLIKAQRYVSRNRRFLALPTSRFKTDRVDARPVSLGIAEPVQLFTDRQLAVFGRGFRWLEEADMSFDMRRALTLGLSNALATNNKFCGYARDYGRIAPLFSVRGYSLPALSVELNPFHPKAGRGTLQKVLERLVRSCEASEVRRYVWSAETKRPAPKAMQFKPYRAKNGVRCESAAARGDGDRHSVDLCVFDPPYFDYIAYSELSEFHRAWLSSRRLGGIPLLPDAADPVGSFAKSLAECLRAIKRRLRPGRPLAFTYHAATSDAWDSVGQALDASDLVVTALWPLRNDIHMGHHTANGNCEWDVVVVCRRSSECRKTASSVSVNHWRQAIGRLPLSDADLKGMKHAIAMAKDRFGEPN